MKYNLLTLFMILSSGFCIAGSGVTIIDGNHYSNVFGELRNYRIFLPPGYFDHPKKRYPVIYYYHGWSQRYFGDTSHDANGVDKGTDNGGDNIENFVKSHEVIVVKPDGYNRRPDQPYYLRPYNVSPVETFRQFPLYFPEIVQYIDTHYRTIPDRNHRAISGLSMGGFMTWWIGGKYPHLVSAAGNFCGSVEFFNGPRDFPVEYRHLDMYDNYGGMNVRLHYGTRDFIRGYHRDVNRVWTQVMDNYDYAVYDAAHSTCGLGDMYEFIMETFRHPPGKPQVWHHIDVYPSFTVWDYKVESDRNLPGFTVLKNVTAKGFRASVREHLPDGALMPFVKLTVTTAPVYGKGRAYAIHDLNPLKGTQKLFTLYSDEAGRLQIPLDGGYHEIGISGEAERPNLCIAATSLKNTAWVTEGKDAVLSVRLLNKGNATAHQVTGELMATKKGTSVKRGKVSFGDIPANEVREAGNTCIFTVHTDSLVDMVRLNLLITEQSGLKWNESIDLPVRADQSEIKTFTIADGKRFDVAAAGDDTVSVFLGKGNGDGVANPGESVVILVKDQGLYHRTFLLTSDPFINPGGINIRESDNWSSYDHVGGSAKYSVPVIASDCPGDHRIGFSAEYWLPDYPYHIIRQGKIKIRVTGKDETPPELQWVQVTGDNTVQARLYDGGEIDKVAAVLTKKDDPEKKFELTLNDLGNNGDRSAGDRVFSAKIPEQLFDLYHIELTATDAYGNEMKTPWPGEFVVY